MAGLAHKYLQDNDFANAIYYYKQALKNEKNNLSTLNNIGISYMQVKDNHDSQSYLESALEIDQTNHILLNNYGVLQHDLGNYDAAMQLFNKALKENPEFAAAQNNLAVTSSFHTGIYDGISILTASGSTDISLMEKNLQLLQKLETFLEQFTI